MCHGEPIFFIYYDILAIENQMNRYSTYTEHNTVLFNFSIVPLRNACHHQNAKF